MKWTDRTYACNDLTNFMYKTHPLETKIGGDLQKFAWKIS